MNKNIVILFVLMVLCAVGASAFPLEDTAAWYTATRDQFATSTQLDQFSTFWSTNLSVISNYSYANITVPGLFKHGVLVGDLNGDSRSEYIVTSTDTVYVMGMSGAAPYIIDSFQTDGTILGSPQIVGNGGLNNLVVVLVQLNSTDSEVDFLYYRTLTGLKRTYTANANDNIFHLHGIIQNVSQLYCKSPSQTFVSQNALCAVTGANPSTGAGEILIFAPGTYNYNNNYYLPSYYQHNLSIGVNTFPLYSHTSPQGQNPSNFWYEVTRPDQIVLMNDADLSYPYTDSLYYASTDMSTLYRLKIASNNLITQTGTVVTYDSVFGSASGHSVPYQPLSGVNAIQAQSTKMIPADVIGEGQNHVCIERMRNGAAGDNDYYVEIACFDSAANRYNASIHFISSTTNTGYISMGRQTVFNNMVGVGGTYPTDYPYPMTCQVFDMSRYGSSVQSGDSGAYLGCFYYNGSAAMFANKTTTTFANNYVTALGSERDAVGSYRSLVRFNPFAANDFNQYMFGGAEILWQPDTNNAQNIGTLNPSMSNANCVVADTGYGTNMEMACIDGSTLHLFSRTLTTPITTPSQNWTAPYYSPYTINATGTLLGYPRTPCYGQTITFHVKRCDGTTTACNYYSDGSTPVRIVTDCGTGDMQYGAYAVDNASVSCVMPNTSQILTAIFWLQTETSMGDYSLTRYAQLSVQPTQCGADFVTTPILTNQTTNTTNTTSPTTTTSTAGNPGDEANGFFTSILGNGFNPMKILVGIALIIAIVMLVMDTDVAKKMANPTPLILMTAILATVLVTFIGLLPSWILIIIVLLIVLIFVGLRVIFPPGTAS